MKGNLDSMCGNLGHFWVLIASNGGHFGRLLTVAVLCNRAPPGLVLNAPLLFAAEESVSLNTTVGHTKINKALTKQAVTEDAVTQYSGDQG